MQSHSGLKKFILSGTELCLPFDSTLPERAVKDLHFKNFIGGFADNE